jgi:hypothetical protein
MSNYGLCYDCSVKVQCYLHLIQPVIPALIAFCFILSIISQAISKYKNAYHFFLEQHAKACFNKLLQRTIRLGDDKEYDMEKGKESNVTANIRLKSLNTVCSETLVCICGKWIIAWMRRLEGGSNYIM